MLTDDVELKFRLLHDNFGLNDKLRIIYSRINSVATPHLVPSAWSVVRTATCARVS
jgi:hypothetical protein